jgi:hypothetical protein
MYIIFDFGFGFWLNGFHVVGTMYKMCIGYKSIMLNRMPELIMKRLCVVNMQQIIDINHRKVLFRTSFSVCPY